MSARGRKDAFNAHEKGTTENKQCGVNIICERQQPDIKWITDVRLKCGRLLSRCSAQ